MGRVSGERVLERCPLCGRKVHGKGKSHHAEMHLLYLERRGVLKIGREGNAWVVYCNNKKYYGLGWLTLLALSKVIPETRRVSGG
jgi:hypothetical protein